MPIDLYIGADIDIHLKIKSVYKYKNSESSNYLFNLDLDFYVKYSRSNINIAKSRITVLYAILWLLKLFTTSI